jgi:hypothetical protein
LEEVDVVHADHGAGIGSEFSFEIWRAAFPMSLAC